MNQSFSLHVKKTFQTMPARIAPTIGASQKSQSCCKAAVSAKSAAAVLLAGFTDVFDTGIEIR